jgi:hypothetical protein
VVLHEHLIPAPETLAEIVPLIGRNIGMPESLVMIRIGRPSRLLVVTGSVDPLVKSAMPGLRPIALRFLRLPRSRRRTLLGDGYSRHGRSACECQSEQHNRGFCSDHRFSSHLVDSATLYLWDANPPV